MKIKFTSICFILLFLCLLGCIPNKNPPLPETLNITLPSPDVSPEIAAFSGIWEGKWGGGQETIIVIEKIDNQKAELIFSHGKLGASRTGFIGKASYSYYTASVLPGQILEWHDNIKPASDSEGYYQCPCRFTLELTKDKGMLIAYWEWIDYKVKHRADLRRRR